MKELSIIKMALVPGTTTVLSFWILPDPEGWELQILGTRPALHCWTWYSNAGRVTKKIYHIFVTTRSLRRITGLLFLHSSFMSSPKSLQDVTTLCLILRDWRTWQVPKSMQWQSPIGLERSTPLRTLNNYGIPSNVRFLRLPVHCGAPEFTEWLHLDRDIGKYSGESRCLIGWGPWPVKGSVT